MCDEQNKHQCIFDKAWIGRCKNSALPAKGVCEEHDRPCASCGAPATHSCDSTFGLVCGAPLCPDCEHELDEQGTNGWVSKHCRKDAQKYKPWYIQEAEKLRGSK